MTYFTAEMTAQAEIIDTGIGLPAVKLTTAAGVTIWQGMDAVRVIGDAEDIGETEAPTAEDILAAALYWAGADLTGMLTPAGQWAMRGRWSDEAEEIEEAAEEEEEVG